LKFNSRIETSSFDGFLYELQTEAKNIIGVPVIMDITHSLQQPNQSSGVTGGKPELN